MSKKLRRQYRQPRSVLFIYTFGLTWVILTFLDAITPSPGGFATLIAASLAASVVVFVLTKRKKDAQIEEILNSDLIKSGNTAGPEILEGLRQLDQLRVSADNIENDGVYQRVDGLILLSTQILNRIVKKPQLFSTNRRFFNHHLPTIINLVDQYTDMEQLSIKTDNVRSSMIRIEDAFKMLDEALKNKLDNLFSHAAIDLETNVDVLESILKKDGFIDNTSMASFIKEKK